MTAIDESKLNAFIQQAVGDLAAGFGGIMVSLGHKCGLYKAMKGAGPMTARQVAERAGCAERYVREWLNSQAAGGYVAYDAANDSYELTPEQALVLADEDSPVFIPHAWEVPASVWFDEDKLLRAFRTGEGVSWGEHHHRLFCGSAAFFKAPYRANLVPNWLPALDGVVDKLTAGAQVADIGCGHGHSTIIMAEAFPGSRFFGFDAHEESIAAARANAEHAGVTDRVHFEVASAKSYPGDGYDMVCFFDCLHDMGDPVGGARYARETLAEDGTVMLVEPFANDRLEDNLNTVGRLFYCGSTTICCPHSLSEEGGMALGAQAGEKRLSDVFDTAGFGTFRRATETPFNIVFEARL
ncbi:class I SAM-dependent methyltransferase [Fodinicurvata halophila]|uniref:Class I SAM-dependent methyltransferase n=1 Tax=Fodinicurvata halophila TaxID=1419723 RepID=A0ABV8UR08_9PROT